VKKAQKSTKRKNRVFLMNRVNRGSVDTPIGGVGGFLRPVTFKGPSEA